MGTVGSLMPNRIHESTSSPQKARGSANGWLPVVQGPAAVATLGVATSGLSTSGVQPSANATFGLQQISFEV